MCEGGQQRVEGRRELVRRDEALPQLLPLPVEPLRLSVPAETNGIKVGRDTIAAQRIRVLALLGNASSRSLRLSVCRSGRQALRPRKNVRPPARRA